MKLDKSVYNLGDTIKVHIECSVKGGSSDVDKVVVLLVQEGVYVCIGPILDGKIDIFKAGRICLFS